MGVQNKDSARSSDETIIALVKLYFKINFEKRNAIFAYNLAVTRENIEK